MHVEVSDEEANLLLELIDTAEEAAIQGIDHADSRTFKNLLRRRMELLASVKTKIQSAKTPAA